jgi:hypothetical protein
VLCHAVLSALQGKQILQDGIGRATEIEEPLDPVAARQFLQQPSQLLKLPSELMQNLARWVVPGLSCVGNIVHDIVRCMVWWRCPSFLCFKHQV